MLNVAESAYSQLEEARAALGSKRRRGADTSLDDATPTQLSLTHGKRKLLKLRFTDGHDFIVGMEFHFLRDLALDVPPGAKVRDRKAAVALCSAQHSPYPF